MIIRAVMSKKGTFKLLITTYYLPELPLFVLKVTSGTSTWYQTSSMRGGTYTCNFLIPSRPFGEVWSSIRIEELIFPDIPRKS